MKTQNTTNDETGDPGQLLYGFAARAMEIYSIADVLAQHIEDADEPGPACGLIANEARKLNAELFDLAQRARGWTGNGVAKPPKGSREWMIADLARAIIDSANEVNDKVSDVDIGVTLIGIEKAAETIRCMVSDQENGADASGVLSTQAALPTDEKLEDVLFGTQEEMEASLTEALDSFPYDSASEESLGDLNKARELMGQAWQLVSKANGREAGLL